MDFKKIKRHLKYISIQEKIPKVGKTMIESMLLGSTLSNIEVAYNLTPNGVDKLETFQEMGIRKLLELPSKTPKVMLYFF